MSLSNFIERRTGSRIDVIVATVMLVSAVLLFPLQFFVSQVLLTTIPIVLGVASGLYLGVERYGRETPTLPEWRIGTTGYYVLRTLVVAGLAAMVFVGIFTGGRTTLFYGVAAVVGALIFVQIFLLQERVLSTASVLAQILAFALVVRGTALVMVPSLIGVDSWVHIPDYAHSIHQTGELTAIADVKYFTAPLYHLLVVAGATIFGSTLQTALYVTLGIAMPMSILLIYSTTAYFLPVRWALFAAAAYSVTDHFVRWGVHIIPTSMGLVFFVAVFYGVARIYVTEGRYKMYALVLFFAVSTVFTHQISTFILLVFLGAGAASQLFNRFSTKGVLDDESNVNFIGLFAVVAPITALNWLFTPGGDRSFLVGMTDTAFTEFGRAGFLDLVSSSSVENEAIASLTTEVPMGIQLLNSLGFLLLLFITLVGTYTLLRNQNRQLLSFSWLTSTAVMLFVTLGMPILGLYFLIPGRWYAFLYVPMIIAAAYGMNHLEFRMSSRQLVVIMVLFAVLFPGAMLVNNKATHDNPVADDYYEKFAFTDSELAAAETISEIHPREETVQTDKPYFIYYRDAKNMPAGALELNEDGTLAGDYTIYREYQTTAVTDVQYQGESMLVKLPRDRVCRPTMGVVYSNGDVQYCQSPA